MKIKLFTIPNMLTLSNLICGSIALIEIILNQNFVSAFILIIAAAAFDFMDGMSARLLNQYSSIGRELDSLADVVSFGLVPSIALLTLFNTVECGIESAAFAEWGGYISLIIVCFSALRLAKFNVDTEQEESFIGLPTPANALFCLSLSAIVAEGRVPMSAEWIALISIIMASLLIAPIRLFSLKFKSLGWRENRVRYIFLIISAIALVALRVIAIPVIIAIYLLASIVNNIASGSKAKSKI